MNLAFTTILVLVALFPGFFGQIGYHSGPFSKKYSRSSVFNDAAIAVLPSLVYHAIAISLINWMRITPNVSFNAIGKLAFNQSKFDLATVFEESVGDYIILIVIYIILSAVIGAVLGYYGAELVRKKGLDLKHSRLKFDNTWYYLISGESLGWPSKKLDEKIRKRKLEAVRNGTVDVRVEVLTEIEGKAFIYEGRAARYFLNKDGLDRIQLDDCTRKPFPATYKEFLNQQSANNDEERIYLANDFIIFRDSIININFNYPGLKEIIESLSDVKKLPEAENAVIFDRNGNDLSVSVTKEEPSEKQKLGEAGEEKQPS